ncbi:MAG: glycosyltransferase family 2 protein [Verrucomicrobia bacterium]|nr:glycosyltransferase family 2 protein [Verrucomicrobiota bacterium]
MSDHPRSALELLPNIVEAGSQVPRPLISLIVPVWNDEERARNLVSGLRVTPEIAEWVVAAVQPGPILCELNRQGLVRLISCDEPSRGRQMNAGAAEARGTLLCFHHADSELGPEHLKALELTARNDAILGGAFYRHFDDRRTSMVLWESLVRRINSFAGPLFGDQSIFVRASIFERLGGFADMPLMEDIEFSRRLRRLGGIVLLDPPLWSSPRRFRRLGNWRTTLLSLTFVGLFYLGVDPNRLHRWYYDNFRGSTDHDIGVDPESRRVHSE